tara:strand:- start:172 stop:306 length:135 start_codon:yes stop_codon:yes gene_type:complete
MIFVVGLIRDAWLGINQSFPFFADHGPGGAITSAVHSSQRRFVR